MLFAAHAFIAPQVAEVLDLNSRVVQATVPTMPSMLPMPMTPTAFGMPPRSASLASLSGVGGGGASSAMAARGWLPRSTRAVIDTVLEFTKSSVFPETVGSVLWPGNLPYANPVYHGVGSHGTPWSVSSVFPRGHQTTDGTAAGGGGGGGHADDGAHVPLVPNIDYFFLVERVFLWYVTTMPVTVRLSAAYVTVTAAWFVVSHIVYVAAAHAPVWSLFGGLSLMVLLGGLLLGGLRYGGGFHNLWCARADTAASWVPFVLHECQPPLDVTTAAAAAAGPGAAMPGWQPIPEYHYFHPAQPWQQASSTSHAHAHGPPPPSSTGPLDPSMFELSASFTMPGVHPDMGGEDEEE